MCAFVPRFLGVVRTLWVLCVYISVCALCAFLVCAVYVCVCVFCVCARSVSVLYAFVCGVVSLSAEACGSNNPLPRQRSVTHTSTALFKQLLPPPPRGPRRRALLPPLQGPRPPIRSGVPCARGAPP